MEPEPYFNRWSKEIWYKTFENEKVIVLENERGTTLGCDRSLFDELFESADPRNIVKAKKYA